MATTIALKYATPVLKKDQPDDTFKFQPLPEPTGKYPYHLSLKTIQPAASHDKLIFHMVGDTGSVRNPGFQRLVAAEMIKQYQGAEAVQDQPQFLYHLGDIVYNFGEEDQYQKQFFEPYQKYPGPIFAIAGNHDSDVNPDSKVPYKSLSPFTAVFCDTECRPIRFSGDIARKSMIQPNIYWTLETPLANIIGLHSNVPKFGIIPPEQRSWFIEELKTSHQERPGKALIVCLHHAPYSADINHGSSLPMIKFLESAFEETGIRPDIVFSGHVHNYQRFEKQYADGTTLPFIVAGGGGYDELHPIALEDDDWFSGETPLFEGVQLQSYCDNKHGFLKIAIEKHERGLTLTGEYYTIPHESRMERVLPAPLADRFTLDI